MSEVLSDIHRYMLQYIMGTCGCVIRRDQLEEKLQEWRQQAQQSRRTEGLRSTTTDRTLDEYLSTINNHLGDMHMRLNKVVNPISLQEYIGLVNDQAAGEEQEEISKKPTRYEPWQLQYFNLLLEKIIESEESSKAYTTMLAINERLNKEYSFLKNISADDLQRVIDRFVKDQWLDKVENNNVAKLVVGMRSLSDLKEKIEQIKNDLMGGADGEEGEDGAGGAASQSQSQSQRQRPIDDDGDDVDE